jgi:hypothetical protein
MSGEAAWVQLMVDRQDPLRGLFLGLVRAKFRRENPVAVVSPTVSREGGTSGRAVRRRPVAGARLMDDGARGEAPFTWSADDCLVVVDLDLAVSTAENLGSQILLFPTHARGQRVAVVTDAGGVPVSLRE